MVDQSRIGRTTRSNPASYVGAFDAIRELFASLPQARERKYTAGTFSFNAGNGRCPACGGNGFEHVEMQFLSDVYLRCPDCDGRRYRPEMLECKLSARGLRAEEHRRRARPDGLRGAARSSPADAEVCLRLAPLAEVGLEYLRLGQPVPTLSGGEAQRLEARRSSRRECGARAAAAARLRARGSLFLFDEPTTGLHFDDVAKLLRAFRRLIEAGHSLLVIEHNLDVVRAADWIIDLGPEGGDAGGDVVCAGTPEDVMRVRRLAHRAARCSRRAGSRRRCGTAACSDAGGPAARAAAPTVIEIRGAREHNLKNIDVDLGRNRFTVITGVSGSGKSTLAFDILFAEGQRRYLESLNAYARQFVQPASRPDVDAIFGIPPTVAIEQRTSRGGRKSTVATLTEIYHFLRLLYVKLGRAVLPRLHGRASNRRAPTRSRRGCSRNTAARSITLLAPLIVARKGLYTALAKWARGKGYRAAAGRRRTACRRRSGRGWTASSSTTSSCPSRRSTVSAGARGGAARRRWRAPLEHGRGVVHVHDVRRRTARRDAPRCSRPSAPARTAAPAFRSSIRACSPSTRRHGWCKSCFGTGLALAEFDAEQSGEEAQWREPAASAEAGPRLRRVRRRAPQRGGAQRAVSRTARSRALTDLPVAGVRGEHCASSSLTGRETEIAPRHARRARSAHRVPVRRRAWVTCSSIARRPRCPAARRSASGSPPSSARTCRASATCSMSRPSACTRATTSRCSIPWSACAAKGNTLVVVEHDEETIRRADHVIDLGPGRGHPRRATWSRRALPCELDAHAATLATGRCLAAPLKHSRTRRRAVRRRHAVASASAAPTCTTCARSTRASRSGRLTVVTGVSGSGKVLARARRAARQLEAPAGARHARPAGAARRAAVEGCASIEGWQAVSRVLEVDQTPIGKTPRSCPATYIGFWDAIRRLFADTTDARIRGFTASRFSFNTAGGRCEACEGQGMQRIEMSFLPDVQVLCDVCGGRRFNSETLSVLFKGKSIGEMLAMSVDEAVEFFAAHRAVHHRVQLLADVGLGYLSLGQPSPTLSGGESQRIKLVTELAKVAHRCAGVDTRAAKGNTPCTSSMSRPSDCTWPTWRSWCACCTGWSMRATRVVVIEHNLDVMAEADWIIDLGPDGGSNGGRVVAEGDPDGITRKGGRSHTARFLGEFLRERGVR